MGGPKPAREPIRKESTDWRERAVILEGAVQEKRAEGIERTGPKARAEGIESTEESERYG